MKRFTKMKKLLALTLLIGVVATNGSGVVYAAEHVEGCSQYSKIVYCTGPMSSHYAGHHVVEVTSDVQTVYCTIVNVGGLHNIVCSNRSCGVLLSSEGRTCSEEHTCYLCQPPRTGLCQY